MIPANAARSRYIQISARSYIQTRQSTRGRRIERRFESSTKIDTRNLKSKDATLWGESEVWETVAYPMRPLAAKVRTSPRILLPSRACRSEARAVVGKKQRQKYPRLLIISLSLAASTFARGGAHSKSGARGCQCCCAPEFRFRTSIGTC